MELAGWEPLVKIILSVSHFAPFVHIVEASLEPENQNFANMEPSRSGQVIPEAVLYYLCHVWWLDANT